MCVMFDAKRSGIERHLYGEVKSDVIRYGTAMANCMDAMASGRTVKRVDTHDDLLRMMMGGDDEGFGFR